VVLLDHKPDLALDVEIESAEGATFRLSADQLKASNIPTAMSFSTQRGEGFSTATFTLSREIFREYPDLALLNTVRFVGKQGDIAYEGRIQSFPRSSNPQTITVQCVGWMTYLKQRPMSALIIDRRLGGWGEASTSRKAALLKGGVSLGSVSTASGFQATGSEGAALTFTFASFVAGLVEGNELWFFAGGEDIGAIVVNEKMLVGTESAEFAVFVSVSTDDLLAAYDQTKYAYANVTGASATASSPGRKYAAITVFYEGAFVGNGNSTLAFESPRVIGTHGLTSRGTAPEQGYYATDVMQFLLGQNAPKITWAGEENQFLFTQLTWHDTPTTTYDALIQINNFILWELNMWEGRTLHYEAADLTKADWQIRTTDPGVTVNFQGDSIESFANGVLITYSDFFGHTYTLSPDDHAELRDENENNAATRHGEDLWIPYTIPWQCLEGEALQFGRAYLAENNRPKRPGSFTIQGHIQDAAGHWHQHWQPRNSQTIAVMDDQYEGEPRLITATSDDKESDTVTVTVDAPPQRIEAIVARQQLALESRNLSSR
jgi:hypothetical protein